MKVETIHSIEGSDMAMPVMWLQFAHLVDAHLIPVAFLGFLKCFFHFKDAAVYHLI